MQPQHTIFLPRTTSFHHDLILLIIISFWPVEQKSIEECGSSRTLEKIALRDPRCPWFLERPTSRPREF
jgi:hypothetical protein